MECCIIATPTCHLRQSVATFFQTSRQYFLHKVPLYSLCLVPFNCTNTLISKNIKIF